jgi:hypothetical protein
LINPSPTTPEALSMENVNEIRAVEPELIRFDAVEIAGLIVPLLFAILTIVMVSMNPDPNGTAAKESTSPKERLEQIQKR